MSYMLCYKLILSACSVVRHCLKKARDRFLIERSDGSELLNNSSLHRTQTFAQCFLPGEHINNIHSQPGDSAQVSSIGVTSASLVTALGIAIYRSRLGQILLIKAQPDSFVA